MTTHRSLNKLEFKAHMSIHNKVEVPDDPTLAGSYTRDRFGKKQKISGAEGILRTRRVKKALSFLFLVPSLGALLPAAGVSFAATAPRSTDVKVESEPRTEILTEVKGDPPEEKFAFYRDDEKSIELNEDGDPNMNVRF